MKKTHEVVRHFSVYTPIVSLTCVTNVPLAETGFHSYTESLWHQLPQYTITSIHQFTYNDPYEG